MVEHEVLDLLADEAPSEPEKVQEVARFSRSSSFGAGVTSGSATGLALTSAAQSVRPITELEVTMLKTLADQGLRQAFSQCLGSSWAFLAGGISAFYTH